MTTFKHTLSLAAFSFLLCQTVYAYPYPSCQERKMDQCSLHSRVLADCQDTVFGRIPDKTANEIKVCHQYYLVSANPVTKTPNYVAYHLKAGQPRDESVVKMDFCADPCLPVGKRAEPEDFQGVYPLYN